MISLMGIIKGLVMISIKTLLIALCIMASNKVLAFQILDDNSLSQISGQDGITITLNTNQITADRVIWTDHDGLEPIGGDSFGVSTPTAGSVVLGNGTLGNQFKMSGGTTKIIIDADGGGNSLLNINVQLPENLSIETGKIYTAVKDNNNQLINQIQIMDNMTIGLSGLNMNLQLGAPAQGGFLKIFGVVDSGILISNVRLISSATLYQGVGFDQVAITDAGGPDLNFDGVTVGILSTGLKITPSLGKSVDIAASNVRFGDLSNSSTMGAIAISNLKLGGTSLTIAGY